MHAEQLSQTLLAVWRQRDRSSPWGRRLIAALVILPALAALTWLDGPLRLGVAAAVVVVAMHIVWMVVSTNLQVQNHPTAARCVPGHARALQQAVLVGWVICTLLTTGLLWVALPPVVMWQSLLLGNAAAAVFSFWSSRYWWLWFALSFYAPLAGVFSKTLKPPLMAAHALWMAHTDLLLPVGLLALAALLPIALGRGDARHHRAYERMRRLQEVQRMFQEGRQMTPAQTFASLERISRPFNTLIWAWRRRVVERADNRRPSSVLARAEVVLNANQHWTYQLLTAITVVTFVVLSLVAVMAWTPVPLRDLLHHGAFGISIGLASLAANPTLSRPMLWQTRREQALLRLLPGMPQGAALNRAVAWIGMRHALLAILLAAAAMLPLAWVTGRIATMWLPIVAVPWAVFTTTRAPARMRPPTAATTVLPVLAFYATAVGAYLATDRLGLPMVPVAAGLLVASAALGAWRWHRLDTHPVALPAGRLV